MSGGGKIVIVGAGEFAEIACEYFSVDSAYDVVGFTVEQAHLKSSEFCGRPVVPFENIAQHYPSAEHKVFVAVAYSQLNRARTRLYHTAKALGYTAVSYVSSRATVWRNVRIGENCFIFENNNIQYGATLGNNIIMWSGNHVAHGVEVRDNVFMAGHVVIAGSVVIGENCFLGANSTIGDRVHIGEDCVIGAGAVVLKDTVPDRIYRGNPAVAADVSSRRAFGVKDRSS